jgi:hypothetical protein
MSPLVVSTALLLSPGLSRRAALVRLAIGALSWIEPLSPCRLPAAAVSGRGGLERERRFWQASLDRLECHLGLIQQGEIT